MKTHRLIGARDLFTITLVVIGLTFCGVYFWGLGSHHTFFENSIWSITILSAVFFLFITVGLFYGIKVKDDFGVLKSKIPSIEIGDAPTITPTKGVDIDLDGDEGCLGILVSIVIWIVVTFFLTMFLWLFAQFLWVALLAFTAMLYWIFFRALRLVFRNAHRTKGNLLMSMGFGLFYTFLYNFWIYGIFVVIAYLNA